MRIFSIIIALLLTINSFEAVAQPKTLAHLNGTPILEPASMPGWSAFARSVVNRRFKAIQDRLVAVTSCSAVTEDVGASKRLSAEAQAVFDTNPYLAWEERADLLRFLDGKVSKVNQIADEKRNSLNCTAS